MTDDQQTLSTQEAIDEELVAYLDGELDAPAATRVERRLADDPVYRSRLARLQQAWDMLDTLGRTDADDNFTQSTVAMVALKAQGESTVAGQAARRRKSLGWIAAIAAVLVAAAVGYAVKQHELDRPNRELVRDLPVIQRIDEYSNLESVEFLQQLQQEGLFAAEVERAP